MLLRLPRGRGAAHRQVLDSAPKPGEVVAFDVREDEHALGIEDAAGDPDVLEMVPADRDLTPVAARYAVGDDHRSADDCVIKPVLDRGDGVPDGVGPAPRIEGAGIGDEGVGPVLLHLIDHLPGKDRVYVGVAPPFPDVEFDGRKVARANHPVKPGRIKEAADLLYLALVVAPRPEIREIDVCHRRLLPYGYSRIGRG
ncbi:hypothetical protein DSECCO2_542630 [anaerobic digester metagenome]